MVGLIKVLVLEGVEYGIIVNVICFGYVKILLVEKQILEQAKFYGMMEEEVIEKVFFKVYVVKDFVKVEILGVLVFFLVGEGVVIVIGIVILVDGGWVVK